MKLRPVILILLTIAMLVSCTPQATETAMPTEPPSTSAQPTATVIPTNTEPPVLATVPLPTIPAMQIGSTHYYIDGTTLVAVPAGEFLMGANKTDNSEHTVNLGNFWIYSTKVTNQQFALCEALGKCTTPNLEDNPTYKDNAHANDPVVGVTYDQAAAYCSFVQGRLPTEAEWEKSARNPDGGLYPWGDAAPSCDLVNFNDCVSGTTNVVAHMQGASFYGVLDLMGNAFEWVADWYDANYYANSSTDDPQGPTNGTERSVRSSSYASEADQISITNRMAEDPQNHRPDLGFRCVVEDPTAFASFCESPMVYSSDVNAATQAADTCPALDIHQAPYCAGKLPLTNVRFEGPSDATIEASNCTPSDDPNLFTCPGPKTVVSITASCQVNLTGNSLCPNGYSQRGNQCIANGSTGQCVAGNYDSAQQCCSLQDTAVSIPPVCPVGTFYSKTENACLTEPVKELVTVTEAVLFATCNTTGGGGGGEACEPPPVIGCLSSVWLADLCCCSFDGVSCP